MLRQRDARLSLGRLVRIRQLAVRLLDGIYTRDQPVFLCFVGDLFQQRIDTARRPKGVVAIIQLAVLKVVL